MPEFQAHKTRMIELTLQEFPIAQPVFSEMPFCIPVQAVLEGSNPGRVFVDDRRQPRTAFAWTGWGYFYLAGDTDNDLFNHALHEHLEGELIPESLRRGERWPLIYPFPLEWETKIGLLLGSREVQKLYRRTFTFSPERFTYSLASREKIPAGFELKRMDYALLSEHPDLLPGIQVAWKTSELFLEKGLGYSLIYQGQIAASCSACFRGAGSYEISVETQEAHRGQGLATIVCVAFIEDCQARGFRPNWECWWTNEPSNRLAEKLGFVKNFDLPVYWWEEKIA